MSKSLLAVALVFSASLVHVGADDAADLKKARTLFPEFNKSVYTDEDKARQAYDSLVELSPLVKQRLLTWLDSEYGKKKSAYQRAKSGGSSSSSSSKSDTREIKDLREQLTAIRLMDDEGEMKKVLKETGWPTLEKLLRLNKSNLRSYTKNTIAEPSPAKVQTALKQAKQVGEFRYELRKKLGKAVVDVDDDLEGTEDADDSNAAVSIEMSRKAASVLKKNEALKSEIPKNEYEGILELNHWRIAAGMDPLLIDPKLCDAARDHSKDMETLGFFAHESPVKDKKTPWDRAKRFNTSANGENIAINNSPEASNQAWFFSPGHHKNMFKPKFSVMGLGIQGRHYTQLFR